MDLKNVELKKDVYQCDRLGPIHVQEMDADAYIALQSKFAALDGVETDSVEAAKLYYDLIAACVVDEQGNRPLTPEDVAGWPGTIVFKLGPYLLEFLEMTEAKKKD